ncbi:MAG TPA: metal ABC transporter ATP-binding protein [Solirubrobacterales bacterium]|nr:metal ABC transporter ATP-binding protein [Solirubrobacterales bacterium]
MSAGALIRAEIREAGYDGPEPAITGIEFSVGPGELVAVLGPNGGGKTTLFRTLLREIPRWDGTIEVSGGIAYVPQTERSRLDFPVTALDVVVMGTYSALPWYRRVGSEQRALARRSLDQVGLAGEEATPYGELSGGQRQRVLIARALAQQARVLLLDEPLSGVDRPSTERVLGILDRLRDAGCAVLVATHDIQQARRFDSVLCINRGQVAWGPPESALSSEVLERTYGGELVVLEGGERAVVVQHHSH